MKLNVSLNQSSRNYQTLWLHNILSFKVVMDISFQEGNVLNNYHIPIRMPFLQFYNQQIVDQRWPAGTARSTTVFSIIIFNIFASLITPSLFGTHFHSYIIMKYYLFEIFKILRSSRSLLSITKLTSVYYSFVSDKNPETTNANKRSYVY